MNALALKEIGNTPPKEYTHKIPKSFFCVQCGKRHKMPHQHYYNPHCHKINFNPQMIIKEEDIIHLVFAQYGTVRHFKVTRIKRMPGCSDYKLKGYQYLGLEEIT